MVIKKIFFTCLCILATQTFAFGTPMGFQNITSNSQSSAQIGEGQLQWEITEAANGVTFTFSNVGTEYFSITDIYFDDNSDTLLSGLTTDFSGPGVSFSPDGKPSNLPGGQDPLWNFISDFSWDSNSPAPQNGVNPGEYVSIDFSLKPDKNYNDVLASLSSGSLRIGIHAQAFPNGQSEGFINTYSGGSTATVPEPATILLLGAGLAGIAGSGLKFRKIKKDSRNLQKDL